MINTNQRLISILRKNPLTINQLIEKLGLSRNAIVFQLGQLEAQALVERGQFVHTKQVGKPAVQYKAVKGQEDSLSTAYPAFSSLLIKQMSEQLPKVKMKFIMQKMGDEMAQNLDIDESLPVEKRLNLARIFADSMGAATELTTKKNEFIIESHNCPLASVVRVDPCVCEVMASFFSNATGCKAEEMCDRSSEKLLCRYKIQRA